MAMTKLENLIDAEVMADAISAKIGSKIVVTPFAKVDTTLTAANAGDTITVPRFSYIGDAEDVAEGVACGTVLLTADSTTATVKKAMKAVELTDEAVLSGYGDPVGETNNQLSKAIASKVDADAMDALQTAQLKYDGSGFLVGADLLAMLKLGKHLGIYANGLLSTGGMGAKLGVAYRF